MPLLCAYYLTYRCSKRCSYCGIWRSPKTKEPTLRQLRANLEQLKQLGVRYIDFTGGEPLLYPHLLEACRYARSLGYKTLLTTNAVLYPRYGKRLKGLVYRLQFSVPDNPSKLLQSIRLARSIGQPLSLIHTVTDRNARNLDRMIRFSQEQRCAIVLNPCFGVRPASKATLHAILERSGQPFVVVDLVAVIYLLRGGNDLQAPWCHAPRSTIVLSPDDRLLVPCFHHQERRFPIRQPLAALYTSARVQDALNKSYQSCNHCSVHCYLRGSPFSNPTMAILFLGSRVKSMVERLRSRHRGRNVSTVGVMHHLP